MKLEGPDAGLYIAVPQESSVCNCFEPGKSKIAQNGIIFYFWAIKIQVLGPNSDEIMLKSKVTFID
jgi:hypothetical protein